MTPRIGRPRLDNPRTEIRRVRFTAAEDALIEAAAERAGKPVADWMRDRVLAAARRSR